MKNLYIKILSTSFFVILLFTGTAIAQNNNLGIGTGTPDASAMLEILSSNKGLLVPRMTATERLAIPAPANALLVYDTDSMCFYYYKQPTTQWINLCSAFTETDPQFNSSTAAGINTTDTVNWNSAYNWGNHATAGYLSTENDGDPTNELQDLNSSVSGTDRTINISSGTGTTISVADNDNDSANELQTISKAGNTVTLSDGGGSFTDEVDDADADPANELQTIVSVDTDNEITPGTDGGAFLTRAANLDTTRTLISDILLTSALCNCTNLPPAMIQSLIDQGYTVANLVNFNVELADLLATGITVSDLLAAGITVSDLLAAGISVSDLLATSATPIQIYNGGSPLDSLYGKTYEGGLIAYLDTITGTGLVAATSDQSSGIQWYNSGYIVTGATGTAIGTGQSNTNAIITAQGAGSDAATLCDGLTIGIYSDWFLPSKDELNQLYQNLYANGLGAFASFFYWSSTEFSSLDAWGQDFSVGIQSGSAKDYTFRLRAVRAF